MTTRLILILSSLVVSTTETFAHRPYEHAVGDFKRSDGITFSIIEHYTDGILGDDPVSVQFRLPDGTTAFQTDRSLDGVVVRNVPCALEIYRFRTDWIPIANRIQQFDGYALTEITTPSKRFYSPFIHTRAHWLSYVVVLGVAALFAGCWLGISRIPKRGRLVILRIIGFVSIGLAVGLYVLIVLWITPVSPPILCLLGFLCIAPWLMAKRFLRHSKSN